MKEILAIIPARSGSKSVVDKNIRQMAGKPMIAYSIKHALESKYITRTIVSTDSEKYASIAREYGAEVPFLRPAEYATDTSLDIDVFEHALTYLRETEGYTPEIVVQLRPTYPIRNVEDIDKMIEKILSDDSIDSVRCLAPATEVAYKMWIRDGEENLADGSSAGISEGDFAPITPLMKNIHECYNMPRQQLPKVYYQNACIDVARARVITEQHSMSGKNIVGYLMKDNFDIDTEEEFIRAEKALSQIHS